MAVPSSGPLDLYGDIATELGVAQNAVSLRGMSQIAGFSTPDEMSEFYGYSSCDTTRLNIFGDNSCIAAYTYNQTTNGIDGVYNGTSYGSLSYYGGQYNYAGQFTNNGYVKNSSGYGIPINNNQVRSVSCWVKLDSGYSGNAGDNFIWSSGKPQNGIVRKGLWFRGGSGTAYIGQYFIHNIDNTYYPEETYSIPWDTWTHIVLAGNKWYKNGALWITMSAEFDNTSDTYGMYHGVNGAYDYGYLINDSYGKPLRGGLDQLRVFNKVISASEVSALYNEVSCEAYIPPPPPDSYKTILYTGDGSASKAITGVGFSPDLVIIDSRTQSWPMVPYDRVRGAGQWMPFPFTSGQSYYSTVLKSFDSDGFTVGNDVDVNQSGQTYAAWCFKAGGNAVTNNQGTVSAQVSANPSAGFSIVGYTTAGTNVAFTLGHGLNTAPDFIIVKQTLGSGVGWHVFHSSLSTPTQAFLQLNESHSRYTNTSIWNNTMPTSSVFSQKGGYATVGNYPAIAYCFADTPGKVKTGTRVGTGVSGSNVDCGFSPSFLLLKSGAATGDSDGSWHLFDSTRGSARILFPNDNAASELNYNVINFTPSGFQTADGASLNESGKTFAYLAIK